MTKTFICILIIFLSNFSSAQIHPVVKHIFYDLPLEKSRKDIRNSLLSDERFILKDTISSFSQNSQPYFSGYVRENGVIESVTDSIEIQVISGNTAFSTVKNGPSDFKNVMIVKCKYYLRSKNGVSREYRKLTDSLQSISKDVTATKFESSYSNGSSRGKIKTAGKLFEHFDPYYSIEVLSVDIKPDGSPKSNFALYLEFRKEDK